jgi:hypothetical protein
MSMIAKGNEGFCVCGVEIEVAEPVLRVRGRTVHLGCQHKTQQTIAPTLDDWRQQFLFDNSQRGALATAQKIVPGAEGIKFEGESIRAIDVPRLAGQVARVFELMRDGRFRTLKEIASKCGCLETSAGARLRGFRAARFRGRYEVVSRRVAGSKDLVYEYQLRVNAPNVGEENEERAA